MLIGKVFLIPTYGNYISRVNRILILNFNDERTRWAITPEAVHRLRNALPQDWELRVVAAPVSSRGDGSGVSEEALEAMRGAEIYMGFGVPRELFLAATASPNQLRWAHTGTAGVGSALFPEMLVSDVILTNSAGVHAPPMAETVIAAALHFARGIDFALRSQLQSRWDQSAFETHASLITELQGSVLGLIGYGGIGREVTWRARALGVRVIAVRRSTGGSDEQAEIVTGRAGIERVLRESDVVVIALPATPETRGLIGARELALLKRTAVLINVARGSIIDEQALVGALRTGALRGAALDVFEREPLPADSPLWQLPNVLLLPHVSATTPHFWERETDLIVDNLQRYLTGKPLRNVVDKARGY